jgi:16S rRNA (guanine527-N7)-methyltransferase
MGADRADFLPAESLTKLRRYSRLLGEVGVRAGVIAAGDRKRLWERHVVDSLRAVDCVPQGPAAVADLGSGGGLPGIPLAIARPDLAVTLIEPRERRVAFLEMVVDSLSLANVRIHAARAEAVGGAFDRCLARAFGDLRRSWEAAFPLLRDGGGALVYFAGRSWSPAASEVADLLAAARLRLDVCSRMEFPWQGPLVIMGAVP